MLGSVRLHTTASALRPLQVGLQAKLLGEGGLEPVDIEDYVEEQAHQW